MHRRDAQSPPRLARAGDLYLLEKENGGREREKPCSRFFTLYCSRLLHCRIYSGGKQSAYCSSIKERDFPDSIAKGFPHRFLGSFPELFVKAGGLQRRFAKRAYLRESVHNVKHSRKGAVIYLQFALKVAFALRGFFLPPSRSTDRS